jgi:hypothetical protein
MQENIVGAGELRDRSLLEEDIFDASKDEGVVFLHEVSRCCTSPRENTDS